MLELASGSGEHAVEFQQRFPGLIWQATDPDPDHRSSINAWIRHCGLSDRMPDALNLDVMDTPWPILKDLAAMVCINLLHISPPACSSALFRNASALLPRDSSLLIYGPFRRNGKHTSPSNAEFDASLRQRNQAWGVRDLERMEQEAHQEGLNLHKIIPMPANNFSLLLRWD